MVRRRERCELSRYTLDSLRRLGCIRRAVRPMKTEDRRVCPSCGNEFSGAMEFCPVCMLHGVSLMTLSPASLLLKQTTPKTPEVRPI